MLVFLFLQLSNNQSRGESPCITYNMENKRLELKLYEGIELKVTVENGVLVAEYSEEENSIEVPELDVPIGGAFEFEGNNYIVKKQANCLCCDLFGICPNNIKCTKDERKDRTGVVFEIVAKP